ALQEIIDSGRTDTLPSVILLTDGEHNTGESYNDLYNYYTGNNLNIPIYSIAMGNASEGELNQIAQLSKGRVCNGTGGEQALVQCFKDFRGSN
ncbi:MAG: VWA domain-containing protein, partial [Desulfobulbaceae bacterium]|nr:VWA domain-containing protein [Desulfobulbaceae bacterium]